MASATKILCDWCHKRVAKFTAYREVGFGVEIKVAEVCTTCKNKIEGRD